MRFGRDVSQETEGLPKAEAESVVLGSSSPGFSAPVPTAQEVAARSARRRLWAADVACYYAQKRFGQSEDAKDHQQWQSRQKESQEAAAAVREAEQALAQRAIAGEISPA